MISANDMAFYTLFVITIIGLIILGLWLLNKSANRRLIKNYNEKEDKSKQGELRRTEQSRTTGHRISKKANASTPKPSKYSWASRGNELPDFGNLEGNKLLLATDYGKSAKDSGTRKRKKRNIKSRRRFG